MIEAERRGDYLGKTVQVRARQRRRRMHTWASARAVITMSVQVVPHLTNEIQDWIQRVAVIPVDSTKEPADVRARCDVM